MTKYVVTQTVKHRNMFKYAAKNNLQDKQTWQYEQNNTKYINQIPYEYVVNSNCPRVRDYLDIYCQTLLQKSFLSF